MKLGLIGLGFMGLTHLKALRKIPGVEIVAVASNDPVALSGDLTAVGGNLGVEGERFDFAGMHRYEDWREAVRDPAAEAVDLCLPTHLHAPAALAALEASAPGSWGRSVRRCSAGGARRPPGATGCRTPPRAAAGSSTC